MMPIKHIFTLLFLLFAIQATGKRDSMLWVNIKEMGQTYQKGLRDSALAKAKRLLLVAEEQNDDLAQAQLHSVIGFCYNDQGNLQAAIEELQKCITIGEANDFIGKAAQKFVFFRYPSDALIVSRNALHSSVNSSFSSYLCLFRSAYGR